MAAREVLVLNEATPQIEAAQSGDTYELPRDTNVTGALTCGAFTSLGIDDNATSERWQIGNSTTIVGSSVATSSYFIFRPIDDGLLAVGGGTSGNDGAMIQLYGGTHASLADDVQLFSDSGTTQLHFDKSASTWDFQGHAVLIGCSLTLPVSSPSVGNHT